MTTSATTSPTLTSTTSSSSTRMRMLVRWSANSLAKTAPTPVNGEPSRRMPGSLEIGDIDRVEARLHRDEPQQPAAAGHDLLRDLGADVGGRRHADVVRCQALDLPQACEPPCHLVEIDAGGFD